MNPRPRLSTVGPVGAARIPADLSQDDLEPPPLDIDDDSWEAFLPDDDQSDPLPEPGDFWIESDQLNEHLPAA